ncbi:MAG: hypothetical protein IJ899_16460 [Blautia sp.]|nr:hypothetical protein [Blautia sp.]
MKDYTCFKSQIQYTEERENELDALLKDQELMSALDRICRKSDANLPIYIQFLMKKSGGNNLHDFAKMIVEHARMTRPGIC